jgi:hypothetical protein
MPGAICPAQESDSTLGVAVKPCMEKLKVCFKLPDVATRITPLVRALVVEKGTWLEVVLGGITSEAGIVNAALFAFSVTSVGVATGRASETTQLPEPPGVRTEGVHDSDKGARREMAAVKFTEPRVTVTAAPCDVSMAEVEAVKTADAAPAGTVKLAGTVKSDGRLLERERTTPPAGAVLERVAVHAVAEFEGRLAAAQCRAERVTGTDSESMVVAEEPLRVAVTVAV